jgi:hypothetical protein
MPSMPISVYGQPSVGLDVNREWQDLKEIILKIAGEVLGLHFKRKRRKIFKIFKANLEGNKTEYERKSAMAEKRSKETIMKGGMDMSVI